MERLPMFIGWQISVVKMVILPKTIYKFNAIPVSFFKIKKSISNFIWKHNGPPKSKKS
jgi:hypothetical protein